MTQFIERDGEEVAVEADELSAREELYIIAESYREADVQEKGGKSEKEYWRPALLALMTEIVRDEIPLARKKITISVNDAAADDPKEWCAKNYPDWIVVSVEWDGAGFLVTIEENPDLKKFEFVVDGFKYGRTMDTGSPTFDAERFYQEFKDSPYENLIEVETTTTYSLRESKAQALMSEDPSWKDTFQEYITVPVPKPKLLPIRPIKEDEE